MFTFKTSKGEVLTGTPVEQAFAKVADWYRKNAKDVREGDYYASHVTEETKDERFRDAMEHADKVEAGEITSFSVWQLVNLELTRECTPFLPKSPTKEKS